MKRKKRPSSFARRVAQLWLQTHKLVARAMKATDVPDCLIVHIPNKKRLLLVPEQGAENRVFLELLGLKEVRQ